MLANERFVKFRPCLHEMELLFLPNCSDKFGTENAFGVWLFTRSLEIRQWKYFAPKWWSSGLQKAYGSHAFASFDRGSYRIRMLTHGINQYGLYLISSSATGWGETELFRTDGAERVRLMPNHVGNPECGTRLKFSKIWCSWIRRVKFIRELSTISWEEISLGKYIVGLLAAWPYTIRFVKSSLFFYAA